MTTEAVATHRTMQSVFNTAYLGLASQGFEKSTLGLGCKFRGMNGRKCALGWLIPDTEYRPSWNDMPPSEVRSARPDLFYIHGLDYAEQEELYIGLLRAHDESRGPEDMDNALRDLASRLMLSVPPRP